MAKNKPTVFAGRAILYMEFAVPNVIRNPCFVLNAERPRYFADAIVLSVPKFAIISVENRCSRFFRYFEICET